MKLFAIADLCARWNYTKSGIHKLTKSKNFPKPIAEVCKGRMKIFSEADICAYEKDKPWLFDERQKHRRQSLFVQLQTAKKSDQPNEVLQRLFGKDARKWEVE